jgi:hypothetical protein
MAHGTYLFVVFLLSLDSINGFIPALWFKAVNRICLIILLISISLIDVIRFGIFMEKLWI